MQKINVRKPVSAITVYLILVTVLTAAVMLGSKYRQISSTLSGGGAKSTSAKYRTTGALATGVAGNAESASYKTSGGFISQLTVTEEVLPAVDLSQTHVYPNPYKPGSGSEFDAENIIFKQLTSEATIRVFNIMGELCTTIEKEDTAVDYLIWDAINDSGEALASGVYIYYVTNPEGESAKGKFAIIK